MAAVNGQEHQQLAEAASAQPLLAVDPRKLRGEEEMRRIFGARTVRDEERGNANAGDQHCASTNVELSNCPEALSCQVGFTMPSLVWLPLLLCITCAPYMSGPCTQTCVASMPIACY